MKVIKILLIILFSFILNYSFSQTKYALIVAIGNYPEPETNGWSVINANNDIPLIRNALINSQQFSYNNIWVLEDAKATKTGIVNALDKLIAKVNKGDIVVIHFSSHGEQIEDNDNDEVDGLDEVIVPYGAVFSTDTEKFQQLSAGYFRDDLFGDKVTGLRNKLGKAGDLLVIIDACHSGTGTKGALTAKVRGGRVPMVSSTFASKKFSVVDTAGVFKESSNIKVNADAATYVVISGAQATELNSECKDDNGVAVGSLSYAFSKSITSLNNNITYRGLFAMIENIMRVKAPDQKPVLEGDGIDRELFGGKYIRQQAYFSVNKPMSKNSLVVLNAGFVSGITKGSLINFYETGTTSTEGKKPVNTGKVIEVNSFLASVKLDTADDKLVNTNPWAFVSELSYGAEKLKFNVRDINAVSKMLQDSLSGFQMIEFSPDFDLYLDTSGSLNTWALKYPNSGNIFQGGFTFSKNGDIEILKEALKKFGRYVFLKGLSFSERNLAADVQLVFLDAQGNIDEAKISSRTRFGRLELKEEDRVYLRIINKGEKKCYINIVDLQPDGIINPVMPNKNARDSKGKESPVKKNDCLVNAFSDTIRRDLPIDIFPPYGDEIFKVFIAASEIDLEDILTTKDEESLPANTKGILSGLEKIFINSNINDQGTRKGDGRVNADQNGTVFSVNFKITPK